jgi:hypothetical protein
MKFNNKLLDRLANGQSKILVFDCEFWHVLGNTGDKKYIFQPDKDFFFVSREIGGFVLHKLKDGSWKYTDVFFVTFHKPNRDVAFPISHFSTVSPQTGYKLDELEKKLGTSWGEAFPSVLSEEGKEAHTQGINAYKNDPNIKKHHKPSSWYKTFIDDIYSKSMVVVKGNSDIEALKNAAQMYGFKYKEPKDITDIAVWNAESRKRCDTAKLEGTYRCIRNRFNAETKKLEEVLPLDKAHDPSTDASMTLLVALYIVSQEPSD